MSMAGSNDKRTDIGLLILRVGLGAMMMTHGVPKLMGGQKLWGKLGRAVGSVGIDFAPEFWGLCASMAESLGAFFVILGLWTRYAAAMVVITMFVAAMNHYSQGDTLGTMSHSIELGIAFLAIAIIGAGRFSIDARRQ
jgi:putative oxidoreductase